MEQKSRTAIRDSGGSPELCDVYGCGEVLTVYFHLPPKPKVADTSALGHWLRLTAKDEEKRKGLSRLELCRSLSAGRKVLRSDKKHSVHFKIEGHLRTGTNKSSQLLKVKLVTSYPSITSAKTRPGPPASSIPQGATILAKLWDPLFYDSDGDLLDPFHCVQQAYATESAAYNALQPMNGEGIPKFYGSFFTILDGGQRVVYGVLMELLDGYPLSNFAPISRSVHLPSSPTLHESDVKDILEQLIKTHYKMRRLYGVGHTDLAPRNLFILPTSDAAPATDPSASSAVPGATALPSATSRYKLTLIDFDCCAFDRKPHKGAYLSTPLRSWLEDDIQDGVPRKLYELKQAGWITWNWRDWVVGACERAQLSSV